MKHALIIPLAAAVFAANGLADDRIYRCGNEYTNTVPDAQKHGCKLLEGGNITVVQGTRVNSPAAPVKVAAVAPTSQRIDALEQRARDSDARLVLEAELRKAESRQTELIRDYNNGEPEKIGEEMRNPQRYMERVAELKAGITRNESDIAGIRRELGRVPAPK